MPHAHLNPKVAAGLRAMEPREAVETAIKLTASLVAGVAFIGFNLDKQHPINRAIIDLIAWVNQHADNETVSVEDLIALLERVCFQIWRLAAFQSGDNKLRLIELVDVISTKPNIMLG